MKNTENSLLLSSNQQSTISGSDQPRSDKAVNGKSARPMKSMVKVKSIRPQQTSLLSRNLLGRRKRVVKL